MTKNYKFFVFPLMVMGLVLIFVTGCGIEDNDNGTGDNSIITGSFTDHRDGYVYKTVTIGNQVWMAENLKYLPAVTGPETGSETTPYYYVYGYDGTNVSNAKETANYKTYGVLYNWPAAMIACPAGWHLPEDSEWNELSNYLGNNVGGKLKEAGTKHWYSPNSGATNETGFTALPGGYFSGEFKRIREWGNWYSATEEPDEFFELAWIREIIYNANAMGRAWRGKRLGASVRCLKDN